jgi:hypothetical protein
VYLKSRFSNTLKVSSIEFTNFGTMFEFKWSPHTLNRYLVYECENDTDLSYTTNEDESSLSTTYGYVHPNSTTLLGFISFDSKIICQPNCYMGLAPPTHQNTIIDATSLSLADLDQMDNQEEAWNFLYDIWLHSLMDSTKPQGPRRSQTSDQFAIDQKLLTLFNKRLVELNKSRHMFRSAYRAYVERVDAPANESFISYTFPIRFGFKWTGLVHRNAEPGRLIQFSSTQAFVGSKYKNLTLYNPSNEPLIMQIMLIENYANKEKLVDLMANQSNLFFANQCENDGVWVI